MKYVPDNKYGFAERPHYEPKELDRTFEQIVTEFLRKKRGKVSFPIDTEDLKSLIERDVDDLDQYADLSPFGDVVEGLTEFPRSGKPKVRISETVHKYENRLRTTLTHEYGHVHLHAYLFTDARQRLNLLPGQKANVIYCKRETIVSASKIDWLEWQAGYACGALLMPRSHVTTLVAQYVQSRNIYGPVLPGSTEGQQLITEVVNTFAVSRDAARVRLSVLGHLGQEKAGSLFA